MDLLSRLLLFVDTRCPGHELHSLGRINSHFRLLSQRPRLKHVELDKIRHD